MSRRDRRIVVALSIGVLTVAQGSLAGIAFVLRTKTSEQLEVARIQVESKRFNLDRAKQREVPAVGDSGSHWQLLDTPDVAGTMQVLQALGDASTVSFDRVKAAPSNTPGKQSFQIVGHGSPQNVCEFFAAIEQHDRLLVIESGRVAPGGENEVAFEVGLATYHLGGAK